jgi:hypothetical protein
MLRHFGLCFAEVQLLLLATWAVISGPCVAALTHSGPGFSPNDLDFFTPRDRGDQVIKFLDLAGNYKVVTLDNSWVQLHYNRKWC